jgi:hypothetical protein
MRNYGLYIILFLSAVVSTGCKKYLDKEPDNRTQVRTADQIAQLLTTAYPQGNYMLFCESMSDNAEDKQGGGSGYDAQDQINRQSYRFEEVQVAPDDLDGPNFYWNSCYKAIAAANQALEYISQAEDTTILNAHKGEALVARAYAHFMLVTLFSKAYNPNTAASDPGIPYVTVPETQIFQQYERGTVAQVYEKIERDLLAGLPLIDDRIYGTAPKFHFNRKAAAAFAARFYMFKQDFQKVINYATVALGDAPAEELRPWNTVLDGLQYAEREAEYTKSSLPGNLLLQESNSIWGRSFATVRYGLGESVASRVLFRENVTGGVYAYTVFGSNPQTFNIPKFYEYFVTESINANTGQPYNTIPLLTSEEALLNRAEAYGWMNNTSAAINDLNIFASRNIDDYSSSTHRVTSSKLTAFYGQSTQFSAILAALDFKRAFFMHEGMRWFDIIRLGIPVTHTTTEGEIFELAADDNRRVLQLPALTKQSGLEPNPR